MRRERLTFIQLTEAYVIHTLRVRHKMTMRAITRARNWLKEKTQFSYPFALEGLGLECDGKNIFFDSDGRLACASEKGQLAMRAILQRYLARVDFDGNGIAKRFYPFTSGYDADSPRLIIVDPRYNFGKPCLASRSISTAMITRRYRAGESKGILADDYGCAVQEIDEAIKHESRAA